MHKNQAFKRTASSENDQEENKKTRFGSMMNDPDLDDFDFNSFNMETSSQLGGTEHLDETSEICAEYLKGKHEQTKEFDSLDNTVEQIVTARAKSSANVGEHNLINLDETLLAGQDHNYLFEDDNENSKEEFYALKATIVSMKDELNVKDAEILRLVEDNSKHIWKKEKQRIM